MLGRGSVSIQRRRRSEEVEAALRASRVRALVVRVPDPRYGQQVAAVQAAGCRPSLAELDSFVRSRSRATSAAQSVVLSTGEAFAAGKPDYRWAGRPRRGRRDVHAGRDVEAVGDGCGCDRLRTPARKVDMGRLSCLSGAEPTSMWMEVRHEIVLARREIAAEFAKPDRT